MVDIDRLRREASQCWENYLRLERELDRHGETSARRRALFGRRQVTRTILDAWFHRLPRKMGNTETDGDTVFLFGNPIIWWEGPGRFTVTTCGHNTVTTRERLNALPGVSVYQSHHILYLNGEEWNGEARTFDLPSE